LVNTETSCPEIEEINAEFESTTKFVIEKNHNNNQPKLTTEEADSGSRLCKKPLLKDLITKSDSNSSKTMKKKVLQKSSSKACVLDLQKKINMIENKSTVIKKDNYNSLQNKSNVSKIIQQTIINPLKKASHQSLNQHQSLTTQKSSVNVKQNLNNNINNNNNNYNNNKAIEKKVLNYGPPKMLDFSNIHTGMKSTQSKKNILSKDTILKHTSTNSISSIGNKRLSTNPSPKNSDYNSVTSVPKSFSNNIPFSLLNLNFKYKGKELIKTLTNKENGLTIAKLVDHEFNLKFSQPKIESLASYITQNINTLITYLSKSPYENIRNVNKFYSRNLIDLDSLIPNIDNNTIVGGCTSNESNRDADISHIPNKKLKLSLVMGSNQIHFFFNSDDNVDNIIVEILKNIPNNVSYDLDQLELSIKNSILNTIKIQSQKKQKIQGKSYERNVLFSVNIEISNFNIILTITEFYKLNLLNLLNLFIIRRKPKR